MRICFPRSSLLSVFFLIVIAGGIFKDAGFNRVVEGGQRRIHITDDLDDVVDDEEDESWKEWGKKKTASRDFDLPPADLSKMELSEIQAEMAKRHSGPAMGFVKLRLGVRRTSVRKFLYLLLLESAEQSDTADQIGSGFFSEMIFIFECNSNRILGQGICLTDAEVGTKNLENLEESGSTIKRCVFC